MGCAEAVWKTELLNEDDIKTRSERNLCVRGHGVAASGHCALLELIETHTHTHTLTHTHSHTHTYTNTHTHVHTHAHTHRCFADVKHS